MKFILVHWIAIDVKDNYIRFKQYKNAKWTLCGNPIAILNLYQGETNHSDESYMNHTFRSFYKKVQVQTVDEMDHRYSQGTELSLHLGNQFPHHKK